MSLSGVGMIRGLRPAQHLKASYLHTFRRSASRAAQNARPAGTSRLRAAGFPATSNAGLGALPSSTKIMKSMTPDQGRKLFLAQKLMSQGVTEIYRAPSHVGILTTSYVAFAVMLATAGGLLSLGHATEQKESGLHWIVPVGWRLGIIVWVVFAALAITRPKGFVTALDLVGSQDTVKLKVSIRRLIPFRKNRHVFIAPYDLYMDRRLVDFQDAPESASKQDAINLTFGRWVLQRISKSFYQGFASIRRFVALDGIVKVFLGSERIEAQLDLTGNFSNDAKDFLDLATMVD